MDTGELDVVRQKIQDLQTLLDEGRLDRAEFDEHKRALVHQCHLALVVISILFRLVQDTVVDFIATKGVSISAVAGSVDECFANLRDGWVESRRGVEKLSKRVFRS